MTSVIVVVIFWKYHSESYLTADMFEVPSQKLWDTLTTAFWNTPYNWTFCEHGSTYVLIVSSRLEKTSWNENRRNWLKSYKLQKNPSLHFEQHCTKIGHMSLFFIRFFSSQTSLVFKFNLVLIRVWIIFATICFSVCLSNISCYLTDL